MSEDNEFNPPKILKFSSSKEVIVNKETFSLNWEIQDTKNLEIYRNGVLLKESSAGETSFTLLENYDGKDKTIEYQLIALNSIARTESEIIQVRLTGSAKNSFPKIISFLSDQSAVTKRETFTLRWNVENATDITLLRNGIVLRHFTENTGSFPMSENYDGIEKIVSFNLHASNGKEKSESNAINITVKENSIPEPAIPKKAETKKSADTVIAKEYQQNRNLQLKNIRYWLAAVAAVLVVSSGVLIYLSMSKAKISSFNPSSVTEGHSIIIKGKNFPGSAAKIQVLFNNIPGKVEHSSPELLRVVVPLLNIQSEEANATVALVQNGDTITTDKALLVKKRPVAEPKPIEVLPETEETVDDEQVVETLPEKKRLPKVKDKFKKDATRVLASNPETVTPQPARQKIDISGQVRLINSDFRKRTFGGVKGLQVTVENNSPYDVDNVVVEIIYVKKNEKEVNKELLNITNIRAHTSSSKDVPNSNRGAQITTRITSIFSRQLNEENQGRN